MSAQYFIYKSKKWNGYAEQFGLNRLLPNAFDAARVKRTQSHTHRKRQYHIEQRATTRSKQTNIYDAIKFEIRLRGSIP